MSVSNRKPELYWTGLREGDWRLIVAATEEGLAFIGSQGGTIDELAKWANAQYKDGCELIRDDNRLAPYTEQLIEYLQGQRTSFDLATALRGTAFQQSVWSAMSEIGYGDTATYSQIAERIGKPDAVRAVGSAIGRNPALIVLPCHRIVGKNGALTGYRGGLEMKERLLRLERES
ncbi:methylated-DNA--[protein]-cysteine S-methyltransferase [Cohnella panacarvi]|uniref:methylated-DNA--[protein]-cysteine S-methyltransferase n=1 Tax=Cohnella panacarvi TaxID=400776 RepID=UPI00047C88BB|nr:methylated-DNA--[protein]-cysteine S-methyltransferase [Cohnella panacarvi]